MSKIQVASIIVSLFLFILIFELVRRKRLRVEDSILWLFTGGILVVFSIWRNLLDILGHLVGIFYAPSALFLVGFVLCMVLLLRFSVKASDYFEKNRKLTQEIAILRLKIEKLEIALRNEDTKNIR